MSRSLWVLFTGYVYLFIWLLIFTRSYKNTYTKNKISLLMSSLFGLPASYSYSIFATILYCLLPTLGTFIVAAVSGINIPSIFAWGSQVIPITLLSISAAMSLVAVFVIFINKLFPFIDIPGEMARIKWIEGIMQTPARISWLLPLLSASFEEIFFRGALLTGLLKAGMSTPLAIALVTLAFILNQVLLADTWPQRLVLGYSSFAISLVGSIAFLACGSIIPSILMHASFAGFYTSGSEKSQYSQDAHRLFD
ncbi:MAG: CPBP family intramembrane metalloprotease [Firmicutes bacterium]|nr:CPBP family intramembrane metalloprotease [Bacillota bacterium]